MSPRALLILRYLADAEPVLTVLALGAFLRVRRQVDLPAVRDYFVARTVWAMVMISALLAWPRYPAGDIYTFAYWSGSLLLAILLIRVAMAIRDRFLSEFPGLRMLCEIGFRWLLIAAVLLTAPMVVALVNAHLYPHGDSAAYWAASVAGAVGLSEFLVIGSVLFVTLRAGLSLRSRTFGILLGLIMEPCAALILTWASGLGLWTRNNLVYQVVTDSTLILWILYLLLPDQQGPMKEPSESVLRWDQVARWIFRDRLPSEATHADDQRLAEMRAK